MYTYNNNGQWEVGSTKLTPEHIEIIKGEDNNVLSPQGLVNQIALEATEQAHADWKADRQALVDAIIVTTTAGNAFDGDEISQGRLSRATSVMDDVETTTWVLADDTVVQATKAELLEALKLAGQAQTAVWVR